MAVQKDLFKLVVLTTLVFCVLGKKSSSSSSSGSSSSSSAEDECDVCTDVLTQVAKLADDKSAKLTQDVARDALLEFCTKTKDPKQEKLCNFLGAHKHSATSIVNEVTKPLSFHKPATKICAELRKKDSQICDLKYDKPIDWSTINLDGMRVKQLKELLVKLNGECKGCTEKSDYVTRINELKPKEEL